MKKLIALFLVFTQSAWAGLPPTSSKISGDSANVTTFNYQFPNLTGTHTGTTVNIPIYPVPSPSPSSVLMDVGNTWSPVPFPSPSPSGYVVTSTGTGFALQQLSVFGISTDLTAYTPTFSAGFGTISTSSALWSRDGGDMILTIRITSGTLAASVGAISLPSVCGGQCTVDTARLTIPGNDTTAIGTNIGAWTSDTGVGTSNGGGMVTAPATSTSNIYLAGSYTGAGFSNKPINMSNFTNTSTFTIMAKVPISGWSSSTVGAGQGGVQASYYVTSGASITGGNPINWPVKITDTGCANGTCLVTTGASWKFTAPVTGTYTVAGTMYAAASGGFDYNIYKNGVAYQYFGLQNTSTYLNPTTQIYLSAGEYIDIRPGSTFTTQAVDGSGFIQNKIDISLNSGTSALAAPYSTYINSGVTWTSPTNLPPQSQCKFTLIGGGGAGAGVPATANAKGAGGGSGATAIYYATNLAANTAYTIAIGSGGTGASNAVGSTGGNTTITIGATTVTAGGGGVGSGAGNSATGGAGGTATNATVPITGQPGWGTATTGANSVPSGQGGSTMFGNGGAPNFSPSTGNTAGSNGTGCGAGGGGSSAGAVSATVGTGGNGANGCILIECGI